MSGRGGWTALILAGSRGAADPVAQAAGVPVKALAPLAGQPMIAHVVAALAACPQIQRVVVSIEAEAPGLPDMAMPVERLDAGASPATSVLEAAGALGQPLLITTADNPLMTPDMVQGFLAQADTSGTDIAAALSPRVSVERAGNPGKRTYLRFRDGDFSGCNLFALRTADGQAAIRFWQLIEAERKKPWRMARRIGIWPLILYVTRSLSRKGAITALGARTGCQASLVEIDHPMAAHDVDKASDLAFAERVLSARTTPPA